MPGDTDQETLGAQKLSRRNRENSNKKQLKKQGLGEPATGKVGLAETPCRDWALLSVYTGQTVQGERKGRGVWVFNPVSAPNYFWMFLWI